MSRDTLTLRIRLSLTVGPIKWHNWPMTERKPPGVSFETWIDRQVREAMERGEFDDLPGAGKPIPGIDKPHDDMWWVKDKLRRENVSVLPPTLALRKEAEEALNAAQDARTEGQATQIVSDINDKIRRANARPLEGPPLNLAPFDVERIVAKWRADHPDQAGSISAATGPTESAVTVGTARASSRRSSWWRRTRRRR